MSDTVKLIIKMPKEEYNKIKGDSLFLNFAVMANAIKNGTPLDDVLDKISAEIEDMEYHMIDCDVLVSQEEVLDIIEKYKGDKE